MRVLVTGATGFIGFHVARFLTEKGLHVRALVRGENNSGGLKSLGVESVWGDITDYDSVFRALDGCSQLYHLAADYRLWVPDPRKMYDINVRGTMNCMEAALKRGVEKVVYTSSVGVLAASSTGHASNEESRASLHEMVGHYKKSKFLAEQEVNSFIKKGVPVVIVYPSTPIGPMDVKPTPTGKTIVDFLDGKIPAFLDTGLNFVDVSDVAAGHWLASQYGEVGQGYILGNKNLTLREFFEYLARITGHPAPKYRLPYLPVLLAAYVDETVSTLLTHQPPRIPLTGVRMAKKYMYFDASKAVKELHMPQSPVDHAMSRAIEWFKENKYTRG
ncbi:MAG: NAD-dependent epimerase/dehydratase family protein [Nitrospirae bacterium]|nr:NAD-dependent epimerase/dehydratase family protein [Nitrospirota bacterium]